MTPLVVCLALAMGGWQTAGSPPPASAATPQDVVAEVIVHGNHLVSDADVLALSGIKVGDPFADAMMSDVRSRLQHSGKFQDVQVLKRFASISDLSRIAVVIIVDDGPVRVEMPDKAGDPVRVVKRSAFTNFMFLPVLGAEDGYGLTYGGELAYARVAGTRSRLTVPLTWGGTREAGAELERRFTTGPIGRIQVGTDADRRRNPAYDENDTRARLWTRAERAFGPLRLGGGGDWEHVSFGDLSDDLRSLNVDATLDTRLDPALPRNAVYLSAGVNHIAFGSGGATNRTHLEARGYLGLIGQTVLMVGVVRDDADHPLPPYLRSLLGGWSTVRGFKVGSLTGDTMVTGTVELRVPLTSAVHLARFGVSVFVDAGRIYDKGIRFRDAPRETGAGAGVWFALAVMRMGVSVAHGLGADTRVSFGAALTY